MLDPAALAQRLRALPVRIDRVEVRLGDVQVPGYGAELRPTATVAITGPDGIGQGENVAFTSDEQAAFAREASALVAHGTVTVATALSPRARGYTRAAIEAAVIDLALRQNRLSLAALAEAGCTRTPLRWVASFAVTADPVSELRRLRAAGARGFKIDVDPAWPASTFAALAREPDVVILDWKQAGTPELAAEARALFPAVIFEDPPTGYHDARCARDRPLLTAADIAAAGGDAINLKAGRMGGPLALLVGLAAAGGAPCYFGGMFEVGVGRAQARVMAALFCPDSPNDLGPVGATPAVDEVDLAQLGFAEFRAKSPGG
jgi:L-alanine-DL-glutamate epimerase-like enolase superfamily enzyme